MPVSESGGTPQARHDWMPADTDGPAADAAPREYKFIFTGSAGEYFRIWIVNLLLTIVTLGIYAAWAKVRTRRYFYAATHLDGQNFDYLADPMAILRGNLIVAAGIIAFIASDLFKPGLGGAVVLLFYLLVPYLVYLSLRFNAHNSAYRNIRFRFLGTAGDSYKVYLGLALLIPLTLGLIFPLWAFHKKRYFYDNLAYGGTGSRFNGLPGFFYIKYLLAGLMGLSIPLIFVLLNGLLIGLTVSTPGDGADNIGQLGFMIVVYMLFVYGVIVVIGSLIQQFLYVRLNNYCLNQTRIGSLSLKGTMEVGEMLYIRLTNILAIVFTLGLAIPWAKVRRARYILTHISVVTAGSLSDFAAAVEAEAPALGESATDIFDIEFGL